MARYDAFIFDMNGTMVDDMRYHQSAWYNILVGELGAPLTQDQVKREMYGKNEELFDRVFGPGKYSSQKIAAIVERKESRYRQNFLPDLKVIDGLESLLIKANTAGIRLAIGTAAIAANVDFVLDNLLLRQYFPVIVGPEDVAISKPDPEVFLRAAELSGVPPGRCVVLEDSPMGIEAARRAGMKAVGISSYHSANELAGENVLAVVADYTGPLLDQMFW